VEADLIITGGTVLPMTPGAAPIPDGAVAVRSGSIVAVGPAAEIASGQRDAEVLDADGGLILPGFVNTHTHLAMTLIRGVAEDLPLKEWLEDHIWPTERALMNADTVALGTRLAAAESLQAGVTCVCDMYFHAQRVIDEVVKAGLRAIVPESLIDLPTPSCPTPEAALACQRDLLERYVNHPLVVPAVAPHSPYMVSAANLVKEAELAEEFGAPLIIHLAETRWEVEKITAEKGVSPVAYLADLGILSERTIAAVSNLKLASGLAPLPQMLARGLKVAFGTDGAASNNTLDLLRDAQLASLIYKGITGDPTCIPARTVVEMLTIGGARVLGLAEKIGTLEPGKRADIICVALDRPRAVPAYDPFSHLVYAARSADVTHVVVDGRIVVRGRELQTVDVPALLVDVRTATETLRQRIQQ
jgi:5-methylthioadenosine/S-adenosylhomocysteine deaminase